MSKHGMIKTSEDIAILREGGQILARALSVIKDAVVPGVTTMYLNDLALKLIREEGAIPSFLNYTPEGAHRPYPGTLCVSVNDEVVHGIPGNRILLTGDIVDLDLGLEHKGLFVDMAITVPVGVVDEGAKKLLRATKEALFAGIKMARAGNTLGDIGYAIEEQVKKYGFTVVEELGGHGVGYAPHEEPHIANYGERGSGMKLKKGMVLAIEPIVNEGTRFVRLLPDGYTFVTRDHKRSAQFEHTILVTDSEAEILTKE